MARQKKTVNIDKVKTQETENKELIAVNLKYQLSDLQRQEQVLAKQINDLNQNLMRNQEVHLKCIGAIQFVNQLLADK